MSGIVPLWSYAALPLSAAAPRSTSAAAPRNPVDISGIVPLSALLSVWYWKMFSPEAPCASIWPTEKAAPTAGELEAKAGNGEQISLAEYAAALKAEKEQGKKAEPGKKTEKKPSIRAQLRADKERAAQRKQARTKSQDLERS